MTDDVLFDGSELDDPVDQTTDQEKSVKSEDEDNSLNKESTVVEGRYRISPLTLTVFKKRTEAGNVFRNYQLQRTYPKDENGDSFGYTESLRPRDLRKAARLFELAADDIQDLRKEDVSEGDTV